MSIAAVPRYLGKDFEIASPGMRFGMYFAIWHNDWAKAREPDWRTVIEMKNELNIVQAIQNRQAEHAQARSNCFTLPARSIAPFVTGMGNEHPLENGFSFLWPYGLPYLPGSGVKGVLRQAARELVSGEWGENAWLDASDGEVTIDRKKVSLSAMDILLGLESKDRQTEHFRGVLSFWDVIPQIQGDKLMVEIMTPHQTHYYRDGQQPHDSGQPTPISFLTVPPESEFVFHVRCDRARLQRIAPALAKDDCWKTLLESAFEHAFDWLGFGAKTAVGYGAMSLDERRLQDMKTKQKEAAAKAETEAKLVARLSGLPEDATWVERQRAANSWSDTNQFFESVEGFLADHDKLSKEAQTRLEEEVEKRWKGIMNNPDATQGKKKKPKYKPRPIKLAKRLLEYRQKNDPGWCL